jgi:NitT/TauT family transport system permease protein
VTVRWSKQNLLEAENNESDRSVQTATGPCTDTRLAQSQISKSAITSVVFFAMIVGIWYFISYWLLADHRQFLLPPLHQIVHKGFLDAEVRSDLFYASLRTLEEVSIGLSIASILGIVFGTLMSQWRWMERAFFPWAIVLQTMPILAIVPLVSLWFGRDLMARVVVVVIISLFPIITNTLFGLLSVDESLHDLFTLRRAKRLTRLSKLCAPAALPALFAGVRISSGLAVVGAIVGEFFFQRGDKGLGHLLLKYTKSDGTEFAPQLFAAITLCCFIGLVLFIFFTWLGNRVTRNWHEVSLRQV